MSEINIPVSLAESPMPRRPDRFSQLEQISTRLTLSTGEVAVREGEITGNLFLIEYGQVQVFITPEHGDELTLSTLRMGNFFGEIALLSGAPHSATVRADEPTTLLVIPYDRLRQIADDENEPLSEFLLEIAHSLCDHLRRSTKRNVEAMQKELELSRNREAAGRFMIWVMMTNAAYTALTKFLSGNVLSADTSTLITGPIALFVAGVVLWMMWKSGLPMKTYGLTLANWWPHTINTLVWTIPVMILLAMLKWWLINYNLSFNHLSYCPLISDPFDVQRTSFLMVYGFLLIPLQELGARGGLQSSFYIFIPGSKRRRTFFSIVVANSLFAMGHLHLTLIFAVVAFIPGFLWGWLYARQRSLVGPVFSHFLIGMFGLWVLGFDKVLQQLFF